MALLGPKKDGGPNVEFFQSAEALQGFETVRQWLQRNCKKVILCVWNKCAAILAHIGLHSTAPHMTRKSNLLAEKIHETNQFHLMCGESS